MTRKLMIKMLPQKEIMHFVILIVISQKKFYVVEDEFEMLKKKNEKLPKIFKIL